MTVEEEQIASFRDYLRHIQVASSTENGVRGLNVMWRHVPSALRKIRKALNLDDVSDVEVFRRAVPGLDRFVFTHRVDQLDRRSPGPGLIRAVNGRAMTSRRQLTCDTTSP